MELNYLGILVASILQFIFGAIWYGPLFGKLWGKIHGFDKLPKETQKKMMSEMGPYYMAQFLVTVLTTVILSLLVEKSANGYVFAFILFMGFIFPTQLSAAMFGGVPRKWLVKKVLLQSTASLICLEIAAFVLYFI